MGQLGVVAISCTHLSCCDRWLAASSIAFRHHPAPATCLHCLPPRRTTTRPRPAPRPPPARPRPAPGSSMPAAPSHRPLLHSPRARARAPARPAPKADLLRPLNHQPARHLLARRRAARGTRRLAHGRGALQHVRRQVQLIRIPLVGGPPPKLVGPWVGSLCVVRGRSLRTLGPGDAPRKPPARQQPSPRFRAPAGAGPLPSDAAPADSFLACPLPRAPQD
jgi:hypothetical protein